MEHSQQDNRRELYRCEPESVMEPVLDVIHEQQTRRAARVIDINARGARIALAEGDGLNLVQGSPIHVTIMAPGLDGRASIEARVVFSASKAGEHLLALAFIDVPDVSDRSEPTFFSVFNRRSDRRSADESSISAVLITDEGKEEPEHGLLLNVVNHSDRGIGFVVNANVDDLIRGRDSLSLTIASRSNTQPRVLTARVQHRATRAGEIYYGCSFAA